MQRSYICWSQKPPYPLPPFLISPGSQGMYLVLGKKAILCSSRKCTSRLCGRENSGECSSKLLLDTLDKDSSAGNKKGEEGCDL